MTPRRVHTVLVSRPPSAVLAIRFPRHDVCGGIDCGGLVLLPINSAYATANTVAERGSAMEHLRNYRAAAGRKLRDNVTDLNMNHQKILAHGRRLIFAAAAL